MEFSLEMVNIYKYYYGDDGVIIKANDDVNFSLKKGEIHALLGENGAGKSTLVRNMSRQPDSGEIYVNDQLVDIANPVDAQNLGIGISYQDLSKSLVERHTIAENILSVAKGRLFSLSKIQKIISQTIEKYNLDPIDPSLKIWKLSGGEKQRVEILKAIITDPKILILDEPTSMLTPNETQKLFQLINSLKKQGKSVVIITHHLEEAIELSDRITVMRNGKVIEVLDEKAVMKFRDNPEQGKQTLANLMVGREILYQFEKVQNPKHEKISLLDVQQLYVENDMGDEVVKGVNLQIKSNSILGLAGIAGNGQKELIEALLNIRKIKSGQIFIREEESKNKSVKQIREIGVSYIPENRNKGMIIDLSIRENLILNSYSSKPGIFLETQLLADKTDKLIEAFDIKTPNALLPMSSLSGGNKQKVILARELSIEYPHGDLIIIAENPTIGLDVGTTEFVRKQLLKNQETGAGILLVSSDLSELLTLSDTIAVMYKGKIIGVLDVADASRERIGLMMGGVTETEMNE